MSKESWEIGRDVYTYKSNMDNSGGIVMLIFFPVFLILWLIAKEQPSQYTGKWAPDYTKYEVYCHTLEDMKKL